MWYGINCAHPDHFAATLVGDHVARIGLARDYARLRQSLPHLRVLGGCCGTDLRHVSAIGRDMAHRH